MKKVISFVISVFIGVIAWSQNIDSLQKATLLHQADSMIGDARKNLDTGKPKVAFELANKALIIYRNNLDSVSYQLANAYSYLGLCNNDFGNYDLAIEQLSVSEKIWMKIYGPNHNYVGDANHYLGGSYFRKGNLDEAMKCFKLAYKIRLDKFGSKSNLTAGSAQNTGLVFYQKGILDSAEYYLNEALRTREALYPEGNLNLALTYMNFGGLLIQKNNFENALYYLERSKVLYERLAPEHQNLKGVIANLGVIAFYLKDYRKAIGYNELILKQIGQNTEKKFVMNRFTALLNLSTCYKNLEELDVAEKYLNESYSLALGFYNGKSPEILELISESGHLKRRIGDIEGAKNAYREAYNLTQSFNDTTSVNFLSILQNLGDMYLELKQDSASYCYSKYWSVANNLGNQVPDFTGRTKYLRFLYEHGDRDSCFKIVKQELQRFNESNSRIDPEAYLSYLHYLQYLILGDKPAAETSFKSSFKIYRNNFKKRQNELSAINRKILADDATYDREICLKLLSEIDLEFSDSMKLEKAWYLIESSKSAQLNLNLGLQSLLGIRAELDSLILKSFTLKSNIADYEKAHHAVLRTSETLDQQQIEVMADKIKIAQDELDATVSRIEERYPEFYNRVFNEKIYPVHELRRSLKSDESVLNFYQTDTVIYSVLVSQDTILFSRHKFTSTDILSIINYLNQPNFSKKEVEMLEDLNKGYDALIRPVESYLKSKIKIIPSGSLSGLPFEALARRKKNNADPTELTYLLQKYEFTYDFTARPKVNYHKELNSENFVFSPFSVHSADPVASAEPQIRTEAIPLEHSLKEALQVNAYIKGTHFDKNKATLQNFNSKAANAGIIHLATHAYSNFKELNDAYIMFADTGILNKLWVSQIEKMLIPAKLVVLSACETNVGKNISGEGVFSISRGFALAGTRSVISTFWEINDVAASQLITEFYKQYVSGKSNGQALTLAKRNYLMQAKGRFKHPYYWSAFVLHGDANLVYKE